MIKYMDLNEVERTLLENSVYPLGLYKRIPLLFSGSFDGVYPIDPDTGKKNTNYQLCDGTNGTPDLRNKFIIGGTGANQKAIGGSDTNSLTSFVTQGTLDNLPSYYTLAYIMCISQDIQPEEPESTWKDYTDTHDQLTLEQAKGYADTHDQLTLEQAKGYADELTDELTESGTIGNEVRYLTSGDILQLASIGSTKFKTRDDLITGLPTNTRTWYIGDCTFIQTTEFHVTLTAYDKSRRYEGHFRYVNGAWGTNGWYNNNFIPDYSAGTRINWNIYTTPYTAPADGMIIGGFNAVDAHTLLKVDGRTVATGYDSDVSFTIPIRKGSVFSASKNPDNNAGTEMYFYPF